MADDKPIIVVKKKGGHGGHHGGAWKVAYADFVTAMMAFFMVMWLINSADVTSKKNIAKYFKRPGIFTEGSGTPLMIGEGGILTDAFVPPHSQESKNYHGKGQQPQQAKSGTDMEELEKAITLRGTAKEGVGDSDGKGAPKPLAKKQEQPEVLPGPVVVPITEQATKLGEFTTGGKVDTNMPASATNIFGGKDSSAGSGRTPGEKSGDGAFKTKLIQDRSALTGLAQEIQRQVRYNPELETVLGKMEVRLESDGLVIEIMDSKDGSMFASGSPVSMPRAEAAFSQIATLLSGLPNKIDIIGHTDAKPFANQSGYSNWELSADRANAARRLLVRNGIDPARIIGVIGRADQELKVPSDPFSAANRRITLKVRFSQDLVIPAGELGTALDELQKPPTTVSDLDENTTSTVTAPLETTEPSAAPTSKPVSIPKTPPWARGESIKAAESKRKTIKLPENSNYTETTPYLIFDDNPVIGEAAPFTNF